MRPALAFSVPGTGTRFTLTLLQDVLGYELVQSDKIETMTSTQFVHIHSWASDEGKHAKDMKRLRAARSCQERVGIRTVIPLRSPVASFLTRRHVTAGATQEEKDVTARARALGYWQTMRDCMGWFDYVLFPVEDERVPRAERVQRVIRHLEVEADPTAVARFVETWEKVGTTGPKKLGDLDVSFLDDLEAWYRELLEGYP